MVLPFLQKRVKGSCWMTWQPQAIRFSTNRSFFFFFLRNHRPLNGNDSTNNFQTPSLSVCMFDFFCVLSGYFCLGWRYKLSTIRPIIECRHKMTVYCLSRDYQFTIYGRRIYGLRIIHWTFQTHVTQLNLMVIYYVINLTDTKLIFEYFSTSYMNLNCCQMLC